GRESFSSDRRSPSPRFFARAPARCRRWPSSQSTSASAAEDQLLRCVPYSDFSCPRKLSFKNTKLPLALFVLRVGANDPHHAAPVDERAHIPNVLRRRP